MSENFTTTARWGIYFALCLCVGTASYHILSGELYQALLPTVSAVWAALFLWQDRLFQDLRKALHESVEDNAKLLKLTGDMVLMLRDTSAKLQAASKTLEALDPARQKVTVSVHHQLPIPPVPNPPAGPNIIQLQPRKPMASTPIDDFASVMTAMAQPGWPFMATNPHEGYHQEAKDEAVTDPVFSTGGKGGMEPVEFRTGGTMEDPIAVASGPSHADSSPSTSDTSSSTGGSND